MDKARAAALEVLERCRRNNAWSSAALDSVITKYSLDSRSAALASNISLGVMQNCTLCDYYIDSFSKSSKVEPKVRDIMRAAVYQLLFMDRIPDNAAVNEAVNQTKSLGYSRASGFVNAVLRKISKNKDALPEIPNVGTPEFLSVKYSQPKWLAERIILEKGYNFAEAFLTANNTAPKTAIQVNTLKISREEFENKLTESGVEFSRHEWLPDCLYVSGTITAVYGFSEGLFYVQDAAARCAVSAAELKEGMSVLDACSAPGGKSFAAAIDMHNCGSILSCDLHEKKLNLINQGAERLGISIIRTETADARVKRNEEFDVIIADVPCSGIGVIRKKPDIRYKKSEEISDLPEIQLSVIRNLSDNLKIGGVFIYSTCTVLKAENENVVNAFLAENKCFAAEDFVLPNGKSSENGMYTFWPNNDGTDGFFVCKLRRIR